MTLTASISFKSQKKYMCDSYARHKIDDQGQIPALVTLKSGRQHDKFVAN